MKELWKTMDWYRRGLLVVLAAMTLGFGIKLFIVMGQPGILYKGDFLRVGGSGPQISYSGKVDGQLAEFLIGKDGTVIYRWNGYTYGPYQVVEDPTVKVESSYHTGIQIFEGEEIIFRGSFAHNSPTYPLIDEDGKRITGKYVFKEEQSGEDGVVLTPEMRNTPSRTILAQLVLDPKLTHRGDLKYFVLSTLFVAVIGAWICFPDAFFRMSLWGKLRDADSAEPSDLYLSTTKVEWAIMTFLCGVIYLLSVNTVP